MASAEALFSGFYSTSTQPVFVFDEQSRPIYRNDAATALMVRLRLHSETEMRTASVEREWETCVRYTRGASAIARFGEEVVALHILPQYYQNDLYMVLRAEEHTRLPEEEKLLALVRNSGAKLRSYLNGVYGTAQMLGKDEGHGRDLAAAVRKILRMNEHLSRLMDRENTQQYVVPMNLSRFVSEFGRAVSELNPDIPLYLPPTPPDIYVVMMPEDMEIVLSNLISNAYRFGASRILLQVERIGARIDLTVADDGLGVKEADRLFEWGYRTRDVKGELGLGYALPLVRQLLEQQGAVITHQRVDGMTRFTVSFEEIEVTPGTKLAEWRAEPISNSLSQVRIELSDIL